LVPAHAFRSWKSTRQVRSDSGSLLRSLFGFRVAASYCCR